MKILITDWLGPGGSPNSPDFYFTVIGLSFFSCICMNYLRNHLFVGHNLHANGQSLESIFFDSVSKMATQKAFHVFLLFLCQSAMFWMEFEATKLDRFEFKGLTNTFVEPGVAQRVCNLIQICNEPICNIDPRGRPQSRPVVITIFTQSVRPSQNFTIKRQSLPAGTVGWPSASLMTPVFMAMVFMVI